MAGKKPEGLRGDDLPAPKTRYGTEVTPIGHSGDEFDEVVAWPADGVPPPAGGPHTLTGDKPGRIPDGRRPLVGE